MKYAIQMRCMFATGNMQYGVTETGCVWVTERGCVCYIETECVGLLKKDAWATVAKVCVTKTGCVHIPDHRNGLQK
jgi:hypothetical protein